MKFINFVFKNSFLILSNKTITIKKTFFNQKRKVITYNADIWIRAEKYFPMVNEANLKGMDLKQGIIGDMCLSSNLWGEYQKRYTGIHAFNPMGRIKPLTSVNLDECEWCSLVQNFSVIKDCLNGKKVDLSKTTLMAVEVETVKTFIAEWVLNGDVLEDAVPPKECYNRQDAVLDAHKRKPQPGNQFNEKVGKPEIRIRVKCHQPPEDTDLMYLVLLEIVEKKILDEAKANCEACRIISDSQFDHCESGNCLDEETDHVALYTAEAITQSASVRYDDCVG